MLIYINIHIFYINNSNNSLTALNLTDYLVFLFLTWCSFKNKCNLGRDGGGGGGGCRVQGNNLR